MQVLKDFERRLRFLVELDYNIGRRERNEGTRGDMLNVLMSEQEGLLPWSPLESVGRVALKVAAIKPDRYRPVLGTAIV